MLAKTCLLWDPLPRGSLPRTGGVDDQTKERLRHQTREVVNKKSVVVVLLSLERGKMERIQLKLIIQ
jgi:hypothetical protein